MRFAIPLALVFVQIGCITATVTSVRVRDPSAVSLRRTDRGAPAAVLLGTDPGARAVVAEAGTYWDWLTPTPYEIVAIRDPSGGLHLSCEACASARWPLASVESAVLVAPDGRVTPTWQGVTVTPAALVVPESFCFVHAPRAHCRAGSSEELVIPWENVADARRTEGPIPIFDAFMVAFGGLGVVGGGAILSPMFGDTHEAFGLRVAFAAPMITIGATALAIGVWELLSPSHTEILHPPAGSSAP